MNGISGNPKQGSSADVLGFTAKGKPPTEPGQSGAKSKGTKVGRSKEKTKKSGIHSTTKRSVSKIQDGVQRNVNAVPVDGIHNLVQLDSVSGPPVAVLSIPDSAADNESISCLLSGQEAALLGLGSSNNVNIDLMSENAQFSQDTAAETMTSRNASDDCGSTSSGVLGEATPECGRAVHRGLGASASGCSSADSAISTQATAGVAGGGANSETGPVADAAALDLSMRNDKTYTLSAMGVLSVNQEMMKTDIVNKFNVNQSCNKILLNSAEIDSNLITVATVSPKSPQADLLLDKSESFPSTSDAAATSIDANSRAEVMDSTTGDGLLLNIAHMNSSGPSIPLTLPIEGDSDVNVTPVPTNQSVSQMAYIITSRDKNTGVTQRFRVTVDPESVMYIPVVSESTTLTDGDANGISIIPCETDAAEGEQTEEESVVETVTGRIPVTILNSDDVLAVSGADKEDLRAMTGDAISCSLILQGAQEQQEQAKNRMETEAGKSKEQSRAKKSAQRRKEGQEVIQCDHPGCNATIVGKSKFRIHKMGHSEDRPHKCEHEGCDWSFPSLYKLRRHIARHTGAKPFVCGMDNCGKQFSTIYNLKMHLNSHFRHTVEICDFEGCNKIFNSESLLKIHKRKHFEEQRLKCEHPGCTKTFTTSSALGSHQRVHSRDATNYPCPFEGCNKVYDKNCRLRLHLRSHTGERPFKCTFEGCDWAFTCIQKLTRHLVRHTGERKYQCKFEDCNKLFTRLEHLKSHEVFHSGQKPYACKEEGCNARFAARSSLYMHQKRHLQGKPLRERLLFSCPLDGCDMSFASKLGLKSHIIKGHGIPLPFTGGAGDFELIGLGNDQLHASQPEPGPPAHSPSPPTATSVSSSASSMPSITMATIPSDLMTSSLLQSSLMPSTSTNIPLNTLSSSHDEAASILASGLLQNQLTQCLNRATTLATNLVSSLASNLAANPVSSLPTNPPASTSKDASNLETIPPSSASLVSTATSASILSSMLPSMPLHALATPTASLVTPRASSSMVPTSMVSMVPSSLASSMVSSSLGDSTVVSTPSSMILGRSASSLLIPSALLSAPPSSTPLTYIATPANFAMTMPASTALPKVYQENRSGCARTDFRAVTARHPLPDGELLHKGDVGDPETLSQSDSSQSSEGSLQATFIPINMMTSASLTLRDPATGTRYIQTQLLQDDPPDMPDMGFPLGSHDSTDQSPLNPSLSVSAMLDETGSDHNSDTDFMTGDSVMSEDMVPSFRESTINLQDLE